MSNDCLVFYLKADYSIIFISNNSTFIILYWKLY